MNINPISATNFKGGTIAVKDCLVYDKKGCPSSRKPIVDVKDIKAINIQNGFFTEDGRTGEIITKDDHRYDTNVSYKKLAEAYQLLKNTPGNGRIDLH